MKHLFFQAICLNGDRYFGQWPAVCSAPGPRLCRLPPVFAHVGNSAEWPGPGRFQTLLIIWLRRKQGG